MSSTFDADYVGQEAKFAMSNAPFATALAND